MDQWTRILIGAVVVVIIFAAIIVAQRRLGTASLEQDGWKRLRQGAFHWIGLVVVIGLVAATAIAMATGSIEGIDSDNEWIIIGAVLTMMMVLSLFAFFVAKARSFWWRDGILEIRKGKAVVWQRSLDSVTHVTPWPNGTTTQLRFGDGETIMLPNQMHGFAELLEEIERVQRPVEPTIRTTSD
ncbi:hypothetical protein [Sphingomicrobium flavum]|uniref:hypothetical protein n=1 Tax=Sphingomicrobium flavum TaxID=1229164 RepID=UPI0021ADF95A|nr:hypothetical protein [Sphingomicrobium flavum]